MPFTADGKAQMLNALGPKTNPTLSAAYVGTLNALAAVTGWKSTSNSTLEKVAHGYSTGDLVLLSALTGGAGIVEGRSYFVVGATANTIQLANKPGGTAITWSSEVTAGTTTKLVENSGGSYARIATAFAAAADQTTAGRPLVTEDSTAHKIKEAAAAKVNYAGFWSALTEGTLVAFGSLTEETFGGAGEYEITKATFDINGAA